MNQRRLELRMSWTEVARSAGMSISGLGFIRRGEREPIALSRAKLEDALWWQAGSIDAILEGGEPMPAKAKRISMPPELRGDEPYTDPVEREIWALTELPEEERRAFIERLRARRRRQSNA